MLNHSYRSDTPREGCENSLLSDTDISQFLLYHSRIHLSPRFDNRIVIIFFYVHDEDIDGGREA